MKVGDLVIFTGNPYFGVIIEKHPDGRLFVHWFHDGFRSWEPDYHLKEFA